MGPYTGTREACLASYLLGTWHPPNFPPKSKFLLNAGTMGIVSLNFPLHPHQREAGMLGEPASVDSNFPTGGSAPNSRLDGGSETERERFY